VRHFPLERYYTPDEFAELRDVGLELGFGHVESGPLVRSSYHARDQAEMLALRRLREGKPPAVPAAE
jgi:lipoic acid synthetase